MSVTHASPIKTPQQLAVVVVASLIVPVLVIAMLAALVTSGQKGASADEKTVLARIRPVGSVEIAGPRTPMSADQVYAQVCKTCHETGLAGAHKLGDKAAWRKVLAQGETTIVANAIKGIRAMPPKGGNPDLTDTEVHAAVVLMANAAGANWKIPAPASATAAAKPAAAPAIVAATIPPPAPAVAAAKPDGKSVYESACVACHGAGVAGAPKLGDKAAWAPRLASGKDALYASSIKGKGAMPPKGGQATLSDEQVKVAVDHMIATVR